MPAHKGNKFAAGNKGGKGAPSQYKPEYAEWGERMCKLGATDAELADAFGVSEVTINNWKADHEEFGLALKTGKFFADALVAEKLFKRATGYEHEAVKIVADAKTGAEHVVPYVERYPPDTTACIFWLKNRQRDKWRDKVDTELSGTVTLADALKSLPTPK